MQLLDLSKIGLDVPWYYMTNRQRKAAMRFCRNAAEDLNLTYIPHLKQLSAHLYDDEGMDRPLLYGGAMGGGKSAYLCAEALRELREVEENNVLLVREKFSDLRISTLIELSKQATQCPDVVHEPGKYRFTCPDKQSHLYYMGAGRPHEKSRLQSTQWGSIFIDEIPDLAYEIWHMLGTRLRLPAAARVKRRKVRASCNPEPGWVKEDWISNPKEGYAYIAALPMDNPYLPPDYIDQMRRQMPPQWFDAFINGNWNAFVPADAAIPETLLLEAIKRVEEAHTYECIWGVDVARMGDDRTEIMRRRGYLFDYVDGWSHARTTETAEQILRHYEMSWPKPTRINVDDDGVGGGVSDQLVKAAHKGYLGDCVIGEIHAMDRPNDPEHYQNRKAELFYSLRHLLEKNRGQFLFDDPQLRSEVIADLSTPRYDIRGGRVSIEPKPIVKQRLGRSPDKGDALILTMYQGRTDYVPMRTVEEELAELPSHIRVAEERRLQKEEKVRQGMANLFQQLGQMSPFDDPTDDGLPY